MKWIEDFRERHLLPRRYGKAEAKAWAACYKGTSLLKRAHSLEKGMGLPQITYGRGLEKATLLIKALKDYIDADNDLCAFDFLTSVHTVHTYLFFQQSHGVDVSHLMKEYELIDKSLSPLSRKILESLKCGAFEADYTAKDFDLESFWNSRHTLRDFDITRDVDESEIREAIRLAAYAPSACNRQPAKVYYSLNRNTAKQVGKFAPGNKGFADNVPYYAVITVDRSLFDLSEMYQWLVNGGIFLGYFINARHSVGIGSCVFQFPFAEAKNNKRLLNLIGAPTNEVVCAIVGFGKYKKTARYLYAPRKSVDELSKKF